jgi:hypothetical protein
MVKVVIKEFDTGNIVDEIVCEGEYKAIKVENGININLNHDKYYTEIVSV